jgi:hypothetical protein
MAKLFCVRQTNNIQQHSCCESPCTFRPRDMRVNLGPETVTQRQCWPTQCQNIVTCQYFPWHSFQTAPIHSAASNYRIIFSSVAEKTIEWRLRKPLETMNGWFISRIAINHQIFKARQIIIYIELDYPFLLSCLADVGRRKWKQTSLILILFWLIQRMMINNSNSSGKAPKAAVSSGCLINGKHFLCDAGELWTGKRR